MSVTLEWFYVPLQKVLQCILGWGSRGATLSKMQGPLMTGRPAASEVQWVKQAGQNQLLDSQQSWVFKACINSNQLPQSTAKRKTRAGGQTILFSVPLGLDNIIYTLSRVSSALHIRPPSSANYLEKWFRLGETGGEHKAKPSSYQTLEYASRTCPFRQKRCMVLGISYTKKTHSRHTPPRFGHQFLNHPLIFTRRTSTTSLFQPVVMSSTRRSTAIDRKSLIESYRSS